VIIVGFAPFAVNSVAIKKFIAANQEQLHATGTSALEILSRVNSVTHLHIDSDPCVLFLECAVLSNLPVERKSHTDLMAPSTQRGRQRIHHIDQGRSSLQWRPFGANHKNSHFMSFFLASRVFSFHPLERFLPAPQSSLELARLDRFKNFAKLWPWLEAEG